MKALMLIPLLLACSRDVEVCDTTAMAAKIKESALQCQARGYDWDECPDSERLSKEYQDDIMARCTQ